MGIASGVGLLKLKQWARISVIVFAAILVFIGVPAAFLTAFIPLPNTSAPYAPPNFTSIVRFGMVTFYGVFALLGCFWLYFFNRKSVREQFQTQRPSLETASQHPKFPVSGSTPVAPRTRPLSITIIGWFILVSCVFAVFGMPLSVRFFTASQLPLYFLGHFFWGRSAYAILTLWIVAQAAAAIGLLKLKRTGWLATIALQCLAIVNFTMLAVIPGDRTRYQQVMDAMIGAMNMPQLAVANGSTATAVNPFPFPAWAMPLFSTPLVIVILWFLITRRRAFAVADGELAGRSF